MNRSKRNILILILQFLCTALLLRAQSRNEFIISGLCGYGFGANTIVNNVSDKTLQPYKFGISFRLGYRFESNIYVGLATTFQNGESTEIIIPEKLYSVKTRIQYYGIEIGRFLQPNNQFSLCPYLGLGVGQLIGNFWGEQVSFNSNDVAVISNGLRPCIFPGIIFQYTIDRNIIVGVDFRYTAIIDYRNSNAPSMFLFTGLEI